MVIDQGRDTHPTERKEGAHLMPTIVGRSTPENGPSLRRPRHRGTILLSRKIDNDETTILDLDRHCRRPRRRQQRHCSLGHRPIRWWCGAALLITLLTAHGHRVFYIPGRIVHHAAATHRGAGKTDAKDARIIADQASMRADLKPVRIADPVAGISRLLTAHRLDVVHDRVRAINRLRATMLEYFPALERAFDYSKNKAALTLVTRYATPSGLRKIGVTRLTAWLKARGCRNSATIATTAIAAAHAQATIVPAQTVAASLVAELAATITAIDDNLAGIDARIAENSRPAR